MRIAGKKVVVILVAKSGFCRRGKETDVVGGDRIENNDDIGTMCQRPAPWRRSLSTAMLDPAVTAASWTGPVDRCAER